MITEIHSHIAIVKFCDLHLVLQELYDTCIQANVLNRLIF